MGKTQPKGTNAAGAGAHLPKGFLGGLGAVRSSL